MKKSLLFIALIVLGSLGIKAQTANPVIKDYGTVYEVPFVTDKPIPKRNYKIAIEVGEKMESDSILFKPLNDVARMYNLHVMEGVPQKKIHIAVVIYHTASWVALNNEAYHKKYGVNNPNIKMIQQMADAGIEFFICGQSMMKAKIKPEDINPNIIVTLSRLTKMSALETEGYINFAL
jgi:intracellular sulfur oxidation DsrE/DsrF family protein